MSGGKGGGGSQPVVIGHFYYLSVHMVLCHGPVDSINKIRAGDSVLWSGTQISSGHLTINKPNVFGGKLKEGGFTGGVAIEMGYSNQIPNAFLAARTGQAVSPAYRGVVSVIWEDVLYGANSARPKPWKIHATRLPFPSFGVLADKDISGHANAAYLVAECLTNEEWGLGYAEADLEQTAFNQAAATLKLENFKISVLWQNATSIEDFISTILQHVNGIVYVNPATGQFVFKLIRGDYNYATLPIFDETHILDVSAYSRTGSSDLINQLTVKWVDSVTNNWASLTEHNPAVRELQGSIIPITREYPAIPDQDTARMVALRDMAVLSQPLAKVSLELDRTGASLLIGDVIRWNWPDYGISGMPLRIVSVNYGLLEDGIVRVDCVEDVFGADSVKFGAPTGTEWVDPNPPPVPSLATATFNATYYDTLSEANNNNIPVSVDKDFGYAIVCSAQPDPVIVAYELWANTYLASAGGGDATNYKFRGGNSFTPYAVLNQNLVQEAQSTIAITNAINLDWVRPQSILLCGSELMELISIAADLTTITVWRGVLDTTPALVKTGSPIWFYEDYKAYPPLEWARGSVVSSKVLPMTTQGVLDISLANGVKTVIEPRWNAPYPPADLKVNGLSYPTVAVTGDLVVTWAHRDRIQQDIVILHQTDASIGPEQGVSYTFRVLSTTGAVIFTKENIVQNTFTYTAVQAGLDGNLSAFHIAVSAVREGITSTTAHFTAISRTGAAVPELPVNNNLVVYESHPSFGAYIPNSLAFVTQVSIIDLQAETHFGEWSTTEFSSEKLHIRWADDAMAVKASSKEFTAAQTTNWFKDYVVRIKDSSNILLNTFYVTGREFVYHYSQNVADGGPRRTIQVEIRARDNNLSLSAPTTITFSNPAPADPTFTLVSGTEATYLTITPPTDPDLVGFVIYRTTTGLTPVAGDIVHVGAELRPVISGTPGTNYYFRVASYDTFSQNGNIPTSQLSSKLLTSNVDIWTFTGLSFRSNFPSPNTVSWSAGSAFKNGGSVINIAAGNTLWTTGVLFIYHDGVGTTLKATTDLAVAISGSAVIATYKGGTDLTVGNGKALMDGSLLVAGSIGAGQLVANSAVITNSLQVKAGIINDAHITSLSANKVVATDLSVLSANAGTITAGILKSADGSFEVNLTNGTILIL